jgi:hypothetical protein
VRIVTSLPCLAGLVLGPNTSLGATLTVGCGEQYQTIAAAIAASQNGDEILVDSGVYTNDFAEIETQISLVANNGRVTMRATKDIPNEKAILITDTDVSITGFTFVGARITDDEGQNGAGIRYQGGNLTLTDCWFHDNQEGMLADAIANGTITITGSEFDHNGDASGPGSGYTHNLYVNGVALLDIESSYFHDAIVGHEIKSRAMTTIVNGTRVVDGPAGTASYSIDLPNGGNATVSNDQIEQGPLSENPTIISFGEEGNLWPGSLSVDNTLIENDLNNGDALGLNNSTTITAAMTGTQVYGLTSEQLASGPVTQENTQYLVNEPPIPTQHPWQMNKKR